MSSATKVTPVPKGAWKWLLIITLIPLILWMTISPPKFMNTPASSGSEQTAAVTSNGGAVRYSVVLRGLETPSDVVFVLGDGSRPPNTRCTFEGPSETQVLFDDGTIGPISGVSYGVKTGPVWLLGPAGKTAGAVCWIT